MRLLSLVLCTVLLAACSDSDAGMPADSGALPAPENAPKAALGGRLVGARALVTTFLAGGPDTWTRIKAVPGVAWGSRVAGEGAQATMQGRTSPGTAASAGGGLSVTAVGNTRDVSSLVFTMPEDIDPLDWTSTTLPGWVVTPRTGPCTASELSDEPEETLYALSHGAAEPEAWMLVSREPSGRWGPGTTVIELQRGRGGSGCAWTSMD